MGFVSGGMNRKVMSRHHSPARTKSGDEHDALEDEPPGQGEHEEQHLAEDEVERYILDGIAPEFSLKGIEQAHDQRFLSASPADVSGWFEPHKHTLNAALLSRIVGATPCDGASAGSAEPQGERNGR